MDSGSLSQATPRTGRVVTARLLYAGTVFSSAFLLFLVQPLISKQILPWFGGSAAVWAVCMVFFQVVLLGGYAYSDWTSRRLTPRSQALLHALLLAISAGTLSILADASWKPAGTEDPALRILLLLCATIGLPYFLLSTTGPLIQSWVSRTMADTRVYRFFSLSNLASLLALVSYPFLIEPRAPVVLQAKVWSAVYIAFALLCSACAWHFMRTARPALSDAGTSQPAQTAATDMANAAANAAALPSARPSAGSYLLWLALSAMGCWLLIAVTNHITQNIASVPFLWVLPLTLYLLTFVLCFESDRWYSRPRFLLLAGLALAFCAYGLQDGKIGFNVKTAVPLYAVGLFFLCMFLHGELARMRPSPRYLTRFYLMVSLGGALGGIAVGMIAPRVLPAYYELGIGLIAAGLLAAITLRTSRWLMLASLALALLCGYFLYKQAARDWNEAVSLTRSFYGSLRVADSISKDDNEQVRGLYHGTIRHGEQYLDPARRTEPTTYYGTTSGIALAIETAPERNRRVGVIGLGTGTLAAYGRPGDVYRFYEINPQVIEIAHDKFSYLKDSQAQVQVVQADARLALERETEAAGPAKAGENARFDVLAIDAFSGDSIPVHLITREAMAVYLSHIRPDGVIAFHVTNKFLLLAPVVQKLAEDAGLHVAQIEDGAAQTTRHSTDWILVSPSAERLTRGTIAEATSEITQRPGLSLWTDDFNNLFEVLK